MKRRLITIVGEVLMVFLTSLTAKAQVAFVEPARKNVSYYYVRTDSESVSVPDYHHYINMKAVRHFVIHFPEVSNETWYSTPDLLVAMFSLYNINYRVDYDKKGNWIETFRTYDETKLPAEVRENIKSSYYDYNIFLVQEIEQPCHKISYIIHLEGKTKLINLQVCNGIIEEWQRFDKSK